MAGFETLSEIPCEVTAGDTIDVALSDLSVLYPTDEYTLTVSTRLNDAAADSVTLDKVGSVHTGQLGFTGSAGTYRYAVKAERTSDHVSQTVQSGLIEVNINPVDGDPRTHAERTLEAIEALLEGRAGKDVQSYSIQGRSLTKMTVDELRRWRRHYRAEVLAQHGKGKVITLARFR